jgi:glucokinase
MSPKFVIGVDVGGTFIKGALVNRGGVVKARAKELTGPLEEKTRVANRLVSVIRRLEKSAKTEGQIGGVGLGLAGLIDLRRGVILTSPNIPVWNHFPLVDALAKTMDYPFFVENDANAAALGEMWLGAAKGMDTFFFLTLGTGMGGGLILDGAIWHGADGMAGEVGHMTIQKDGPLCNCGNHGCLEAYASVTALRRMVSEAIRSGKKTLLSPDLENQAVDGRAVYRAAQKGDRVACEAFARMGSALGVGIANLINLLNPEKVVLGGGLCHAWRFFIAPLRQEVKQRAFAPVARRVKIVRAAVGEDAGILGSALVAWRGLELMGS